MSYHRSGKMSLSSNYSVEANCDISTNLHSEDEDQFIAGVHSQRTWKNN